MTGRVVVVGSANLDLFVGVDRRPGPGETVLGSDVVRLPGGKGANQAVAAGRLGGDVAFVGCVGEDDAAPLLRRSLAEAGVDLEMVWSVPAPTGVALILLTPDGENSIVVAPGANRLVTPELLARAPGWEEAAVVLLQLEIPLETVEHVAREAAMRGTRVVLNAAPAAALPAGLLGAVDLLVVNESEGEILLDGPAGSPPATVRALRGLGPRSVVLTLGAAGSWVSDGGEPVHVPAHRVAAVDTTGAGDAFVGALAVRLAAGDPLVAAARYATAVAAVAVTRPGAQASFPTPAELPPF